MPVILVEAGPQFEHLLQILHDHGAGTPEGWQVKQVDLAKLAGYSSARRMHPHVQKAKAHKLVVVTHCSHGSGADLVREADRYHLKVTLEEWRQMRPKLVERLERDVKKRIGAKTRVANMERNRLMRKIKAREVAGLESPVVPVPINVEAVDARVARMGADEDLRGW